jgi:hypothetical protein
MDFDLPEELRMLKKTVGTPAVKLAETVASID